MDYSEDRQNQQEQEQELFLYDGPIDPETEAAIQALNDVGAKAFALQDYELAVEKFGLASEMLYVPFLFFLSLFSNRLKDETSMGICWKRALRFGLLKGEKKTTDEYSSDK
jgi:hypothetical protein